jgi:site-specific DNA-methyltransferase (adenine-specific)
MATATGTGIERSADQNGERDSIQSESEGRPELEGFDVNQPGVGSLSDEWETPPWLFNQLDRVFHFDLDVCASQNNILTAGQPIDALQDEWGKINFMNPPYSKPARFLQFAYEYSEYGKTTVALIKGDPSTRWWSNWVKDKATLIWIPKRLRFYLNGEPGPHSANFPSVIAIYWGIKWTG